MRKRNRVVASSTFGDPAEAARIRELNTARQEKAAVKEEKKAPKHWKQVLRYMTLAPSVVKRPRRSKRRAAPGPASRHKRAERQSKT